MFREEEYRGFCPSFKLKRSGRLEEVAWIRQGPDKSCKFFTPVNSVCEHPRVNLIPSDAAEQSAVSRL